MLQHTEKLGIHGWTLASMTRLPETSKHGWKKTSGSQSLVGAIIFNAVEEEGAKYVISDGGVMWQKSMPNLDIPPQDIYNKLIVNTPHCIKCANSNPPIIDACECPEIKATKKPKIGRPLKTNMLKKMMRK
tara:strand:+ start:88 stop:480 length:393 start_codon:yes stop_codon:yes gene_type:complete